MSEFHDCLEEALTVDRRPLDERRAVEALLSRFVERLDAAMDAQCGIPFHEKLEIALTAVRDNPSVPHTVLAQRFNVSTWAIRRAKQMIRKGAA